MLTKEQLQNAARCTMMKCDECKLQPSPGAIVCVLRVAQTALELMDELEQANKTIHIQTYGKYGTLQYAENLDRASKTIDEFVSCKDELSGRIMQMDTVLKRAVEDINLLVGECVSSLKCAMCKYNPDDTGCVLDGSQFDDDGECHFEWRG